MSQWHPGGGSNAPGAGASFAHQKKNQLHANGKRTQKPRKPPRFQPGQPFGPPPTFPLFQPIPVPQLIQTPCFNGGQDLLVNLAQMQAVDLSLPQILQQVPLHPAPPIFAANPSLPAFNPASVTDQGRIQHNTTPLQQVPIHQHPILQANLELLAALNQNQTMGPNSTHPPQFTLPPIPNQATIAEQEPPQPAPPVFPLNEDPTLPTGGNLASGLWIPPTNGHPYKVTIQHEEEPVGPTKQQHHPDTTRADVPPQGVSPPLLTKLGLGPWIPTRRQSSHTDYCIHCKSDITEHNEESLAFALRMASKCLQGTGFIVVPRPTIKRKKTKKG